MNYYTINTNINNNNNFISCMSKKDTYFFIYKYYCDSCVILDCLFFIIRFPKLNLKYIYMIKKITIHVWINYILLWLIYILFLAFSAGFIIDKLPTLKEIIISLFYLTLMNYWWFIYFFLEWFWIWFLKLVWIILSIVNPIITFFFVKFYVKKLINKSTFYPYIISVLISVIGILLYFYSLFIFGLFW